MVEKGNLSSTQASAEQLETLMALTETQGAEGHARIQLVSEALREGAMTADQATRFLENMQPQLSHAPLAAPLTSRAPAQQRLRRMWHNFNTHPTETVLGASILAGVGGFVLQISNQDPIEKLGNAAHLSSVGLFVVGAVAYGMSRLNVRHNR